MNYLAKICEVSLTGKFFFRLHPRSKLTRYSHERINWKRTLLLKSADAFLRTGSIFPNPAPKIGEYHTSLTAVCQISDLFSFHCPRSKNGNIKLTITITKDIETYFNI